MKSTVYFGLGFIGKLTLVRKACRLIGLIQACPIVRLFALAAYTNNYNEMLTQSITMRKFMK